MKFAISTLWLLIGAAALFGQDTFMITGTRIPAELLKMNYGQLPKGIVAFDLNICNQTDAKAALTSSQIFQALAESTSGIQPIGRQIMLAVILRNQRHSLFDDFDGGAELGNWGAFGIRGYQKQCSGWYACRGGAGLHGGAAAFDGTKTGVDSRSSGEVRRSGFRTRLGAGWWVVR